MNKRGDTYILYAIIEIIIAIFIVYSARDIVSSWQGNEAFDKAMWAKELSLQTNALYAVPGNMYVINENDRIFSFLFSEGLVEVYKKDKDITKGKYNYIGLKNKYFEKKLREPVEVILIKDGDNIEAKTEIPSLNKLNCPSSQKKYSKTRYNIFIDPGHGGTDPGIENNNLKLKKESLVTLAIAEGIKALNSDVKLTRDFETYMSIAERKDELKEADIIISIHIGEYSDDKNPVKAYVPLESNKIFENQRLACLILNSLTSNLDFDSLHRIPISTKYIRSEDPEAILQFEDKIVILLEIGNVNSDKGVEMLNNLVPIPNLIHEAIVEYFG